MQTLTELITNYQDATNDTTTANKNRGIRRFNEADKRLCARKDFPWLKESFTQETVQDQQQYPIPVRLRRVSQVQVEYGGRLYTLREIKDPKMWGILNIEPSYRSDYPSYYHVFDGHIEIYPIPSDGGNNLIVKGLKRPIQMRLEDYATGTIAVENGSKTVTGTGTSWSSTNARSGAFIFIDNQPYEILTVGSSTSITLVKPYEGGTATGLSYKIGDCPTIYEDFQDLIWMDAAKFQLGLKKLDAKAYQVFNLEYTQLLLDFDRSVNSETTDMNDDPMDSWAKNPNDYPHDIG